MSLGYGAGFMHSCIITFQQQSNKDKLEVDKVKWRALPDHKSLPLSKCKVL